jgi:hypothetical protein
VSSEELANDVTGAEALLERHQEYRTEIDARSATFHAFEQFANQLLNSHHYASDNIRQRLDDVNKARQQLEKYACVIYGLVPLLVPGCDDAWCSISAWSSSCSTETASRPTPGCPRVKLS